MNKPKRLRKPRGVTLNPILVDRLLAVGEQEGEANLSRLIDRCILAYLGKMPKAPVIQGETSEGK